MSKHRPSSAEPHENDTEDRQEKQAPETAEDPKKDMKGEMKEQDSPSMEEIQKKVSELQAELTDMKDRWMRSEADKQNLVTRAQRDLADARDYATHKFAKDVVEGPENIRRAITALPKKQEGENELISRIREGLESAERSFLSMLERHGITREDPTGKPFDHNAHEALQQVTSADHAPGEVIQAYSSAWKHKNRLLKPAQVIVAGPDSTGKPKA